MSPPNGAAHRVNPARAGRAVQTAFAGLALTFLGLLIAAPVSAATAGGTAHTARSSPSVSGEVRDRLTQQFVSQWRKDPLYVDDTVRAGVNTDQTAKIRSAIAHARPQHAYVALIPAVSYGPLGTASNLVDPSWIVPAIARKAMSQLHQKSAIVDVLVFDGYGNMDSQVVSVDENGPSGDLLPDKTPGVDPNKPASLVSFGLRIAVSRVAGHGTVKPTGFEKAPAITESDRTFWLREDDPNLITVLLVGAAFCGALVFVSMRRRGPRNVTATVLTRKQKHAAADARKKIAKIFDNVVNGDTSHLNGAALDARDAIERIAEAADVIAPQLPPVGSAEESHTNHPDARPVAAMIVLGEQTTREQQIIDGKAPRDETHHCFFNPLHGPSSTTKQWRGTSRQRLDVPVCAQCAEDLNKRARPSSLAVQTGSHARPYWALHDEIYARSGFGAFENLAISILRNKAMAGAEK